MLSEDLDRLERQVAEDKKELNILIAQIRDGQYYGYPVDDPVMKNRIRNIQDNLYYLEAQLDIARREFEKPKPAAQNIYAPNPFEPQPQPVQQPVQQLQPAKPQGPVMTMDTLTNADYIQTYTPPQEKTPQKELNIFANQNINPQTANNIPPDLPYTKPQKASSTEEIFGKKVMAIAASGLIFISIILFAIVFVPALGTPAKIFMMFAVSLAFLIVGIIKLEKSDGSDERNSFYEALSGCGMGAIFVSLFVCNIHFKVLGDVGLYCILILWAGCALFLSKRYESRMYTIIGQIGITVSLMFGMVLILETRMTTDVSPKILVLLFYFFIGSFAYLFFDIKTGRGYFLGNVFHVIDLVFLIWMMGGMVWATEVRYLNSSVNTAAIMLLAADVIVMIVCSFMGWAKEENLVRKMSCGIAYTLCLLALVKMLDMGIGVCMILISVSLLAVLEWRIGDRKEKADQFPYWLWVIILGWCLCDGLEVIPGIQMIGIGIAAAAFIAYGFIRDKDVYRVMGYVAYAAYVCMHFGKDYIIDTAVALLILAAAFYIMYSKKNYSLSKKIVLYLLLLFTIVMKHYQIYTYSDFGRSLNYGKGEVTFALFVPLALMNALASLKPFRRNWVTKEEDFFFADLVMVINALLLYCGMALLYTFESRALWIITVAILIGLCCLNLKNVKIIMNDYAYAYAGVKFTILLYVILGSASAAPSLISVACFVLAIICIALGFYMKNSNLRMYGLILSMICVVKLVMFDIAYNNTLGHAVSFFISGILCFVISAIYNYVGKRMKD